MARKKNNTNNMLKDKFKQLQLSLNNNLSVEQEISLIKNFKDDLLKNQNKGKKIYANINGEKIWISKSIVNKYRMVCKMLSDRMNIKVPVHQNLPKKDKKSSTEKSLYNQLLNKLNGIEKAIYRSPLLTEQYASLKNKLDDLNIDNQTKCNMIRQFINQNIIIINFLNGKIESNAETIEPVNDIVFEDLHGYSKTDESSSEIKQEERPKRKTRLTSTFKRITASVAAAIVLLFGSAIIKNSHQSANKKTEETVTTNQSESVPTKSAIVSNASHKHKNKKVTIKQNKKSTITFHKVKIKKNKVKFSSTIKKYLGTKFTLRKNSLVYTTVTKENQGYNPYYSNDNIRIIAGCSIRYNSQLIIFVEQSKNSYEVINQDKSIYLTKLEAEKQITSLVKKGGKVESIASRLGDHSQGIEGFYNYDDIKVLKKSI